MGAGAKAWVFRGLGARSFPALSRRQVAKVGTADLSLAPRISGRGSQDASRVEPSNGPVNCRKLTRYRIVTCRPVFGHNTFFDLIQLVSRPAKSPYRNVD